MKKLLATSIIAASAFAGVSSTAMAEVEISGNVTMATDYVFRGVSQTSEKGAIQGGFDAAWDNGFYVGTWASNVDFGSEVTTEMDYYFGYGFDVSENVSLDFSYIYFVYAGDEAALNYHEFVASLSVSDLSLTVVYSDDYFGDGNGDAFVVSADYSFALPEDISLDLHVGVTEADEELFGVEDSYMDYSIGLSKEVGGLGLALTYVGTDASDDDEIGEFADDRVVFSISKSL